jgi:predicted deacylase
MSAGEVPDERPRQPPIPAFAVEIAAPGLGAWREGNSGLHGFWSFPAPASGPHVVLVALTHGNEIAGAIVLDELLRTGLRPSRGRLTLGFANLAAFDRFDPAHPTSSRYVDEDLNRVWDTALLAGPRRSAELDRARAMRPLVESADLLLDLHSMLWPSEPLILCGATPRGAELACGLGVPGLVVADRGHLSGRRLIDHARFVDPAGTATAVLVEAGQHWARQTVATTRSCVAALLRRSGLAPTAAPPPAPPGRFAEVTDVVTAATASFAFVREFHGGEVVARRNTVIALDGEAEIRTPYDDCLLVMPSLRPSRGHTAVRLARLRAA